MKKLLGIGIGLMIGLLVTVLWLQLGVIRYQWSASLKFSIPWEPTAKKCSEELGNRWEQIDLFDCVYEKSGGKLPLLPSVEDYNDRR